MRRIFPALIVQLVLIAALAAVSGYHLPSFADADWDTILFLTPAGIVRNHIEWSVLRDFYDDVSPGQIPLEPARLAVLTMLWLGLTLNFLRCSRGLRRPA